MSKCKSFLPSVNKNSKILILGSMPGVKSLEAQEYYAHPQNRFWKVLSNVYDEDIPQSIESKKDFLKRHNIALFDVVKSCTIKGSRVFSYKKVIST